MLPMWRTVPSFVRSVYTGAAKPVLDPSVHVFGLTRISDNNKTGKMNMDIVCIEGVQGELQQVPLTEARNVLRMAEDYQAQGPSIQGTQWAKHASCRVSLNGYMQSNVPRPSNSYTAGYQSYLNMPGAGDELLDKYLSGSTQVCHQSRCFSTSSSQRTSMQGAQEMAFGEEEFLVDPTPQGIQGDNCVQFKLWMENCQRYNLPNCDEQIESIRVGRKTLAQVFQEQQEIIRLIAENYKNTQKKVSQHQMDSEINAQGQQDYFGISFQHPQADPSPQGLQGDDCANFKVWAHNCRAFGFGDCDEKLYDIRRGRRSLQDVFDEQDQMIRKIVTDFQQRRSYSTSSKPEVGKTENSSTASNVYSDNATQNNSTTPHSTPPSNETLPKLSQKDQLKRAVKEYGSTVIVFHIGISLISLGGFYLAVSSGLDVVGILTKLGVGESILQSKLATGSTTFVAAYAVHKVFAPVRIATTLTCTPFIVRYLRRVGFLKPPK